MNPYMCIFLLIAVAAGDYRPVIGIVAFPSEFEQYDQGNFTQIQPLEKFLQVPKSYVDWIEAAGARVIPIPFDVSQETLFIKLRYLNAVIIPGG
jgi:gamma-glutamyl hydrolase